MAVSVAYGVLLGTLFLLFFFPPLIMYMNDMRRARFWLWRGGEDAPTRIEVEPVYKIAKRNQEVDGGDMIEFNNSETFTDERNKESRAEDNLLDL